LATFDGISLAPVAIPLNIPNPKRRQFNAYPRVNGRQSLDMGTDGGRIIVDAVLYATTLGGLNSQEVTWYNYQAAGTACVFVDTAGNSLSGIILDTYEQVDRIVRAADGGYARKVRFTFLYNT
jgi:hypothetical protein